MIIFLFYDTKKMNSKYEKFYNLFNQDSFTTYQLKDLTNEEIDFKLLSTHPDIHYSWIQKDLNENWDCWQLSQHQYLSIPSEFIIKNLNSKWDFIALSKNNYFNIEWFELFPDADWDFNEITNVLFREIDLKILQKYPNENWDFKILSQEAKTQFEFNWLEHFPNANWDFKKLTKHKKFFIEFINRFPNAEWDFTYLSKRGKITLDILKQFPYPKKWNFQKLSRNKNFELDWLELFPLEDWDFDTAFCSLQKLQYSFPFNRLIKLQYIIPHKPLLKYIKNSNVSEYETIAFILLNADNFRYCSYKNDIEIQKIYELLEIDDEEKKNMIKVIEKGIRFNKYYPEMFYKINSPLQVHDLSGEIYNLDNWLESSNIIEDFKIQNKELDLENFDIFVNDIYLTQVSNNIQKEIILNTDMESNAILVYKENNETNFRKNKYYENLNLNCANKYIKINFY